jgi:uncharacterized protein YrrD
MIELKEGIGVFTANGEEVGRINRFVLDPTTNEVTHIVVEKGWLLPEDKVVPFDMVRSVNEEKVVLNDDIHFSELPPFEETYFVRATEEEVSLPKYQAYGRAPGYYWYPSIINTNTGVNTSYPAYGLMQPAWPPAETKRNVPEDTVTLREGSNVVSSDGQHVGDVERLFVDPNSNETTHFLISQGVLFKDRKLVPTHWVKSVEEDKVHLTVSANLLERLPTYEE